MIYLDNAATGRYKPQSVYEEMMKQLQNAANPGRSGHFPSLRAAEALEGVRTNLNLAQLIALGEKALFAGEIEQLRMPVDGAFADDGSKLTITDAEANVRALRAFIYAE